MTQQCCNVGTPSIRRRKSPNAECSLNKSSLQHHYTMKLPCFCLILIFLQHLKYSKSNRNIEQLCHRAQQSMSRLAWLRTEDAGKRLFGATAGLQKYSQIVSWGRGKGVPPFTWWKVKEKKFQIPKLHHIKLNSKIISISIIRKEIKNNTNTSMVIVTSQ